MVLLLRTSNWPSRNSDQDMLGLRESLQWANGGPGGLTVVAGCFILFGATSIVAGILPSTRTGLIRGIKRTQTETALIAELSQTMSSQTSSYYP